MDLGQVGKFSFIWQQSFYSGDNSSKSVCKVFNVGRVHTAKIHSTIAWHHIDMVVRQSHPLGLAQPREPEHPDLLGDALPVVGGHKSLQALPQLPPHSLHPGHHRPQLLLPITSLRWVKQDRFQQGSCWSTRVAIPGWQSGKYNEFGIFTSASRQE